MRSHTSFGHNEHSYINSQRRDSLRGAKDLYYNDTYGYPSDTVESPTDYVVYVNTDEEPPRRKRDKLQQILITVLLVLILILVFISLFSKRK